MPPDLVRGGIFVAAAAGQFRGRARVQRPGIDKVVIDD
jgi:hypothetical protein